MALPATADEIWPYIEKWPFAVVGFVTPNGEPRAAGVMYKVKDRVLNVLTGPDTWKVKHIEGEPQRRRYGDRPAPSDQDSVGATGRYHVPGHATIVPIDDVDAELRADLASRCRRHDGRHVCDSITPVGRFVTCGIGVPLIDESPRRVPRPSAGRLGLDR